MCQPESMVKQLRFFFFLLTLILAGYGLLVSPRRREPEPARVTSRYANGLPDSVLVSAGSHYQRGPVGQFFLGRHNRAIWAAPVKVKVLYINQTPNNLKIVEVGGGMQTLSFTLTDSSGRTYALRSVDKNPVTVIPAFWRTTFVGAFVRDQISGANPYGALVVPVLAEATGILHARPRLYYVRPRDSAFGSYAARVGGRLFLLEEKFKDSLKAVPQLSKAPALVNTNDLLYHRFRYNTHHIDQEKYLKCRLLDFLIGDWDRHNGQWTWAAFTQGAETYYQPIPKDRDQAFCNYRDGLLPWLMTRSWALPKFGSFTAGFGDVYGLTVNASYLDERALVNLSEQDFGRMARQIQQNLTDQVLQKAIHRLPARVHQQIGTELKTKLIARRAQLPLAAQQFYRLLAKRICIAGSDQSELFEVQRWGDQQTRVRIFQLQSNNKRGRMLFNRVFLRQHTEQITLHGLGGNDVIRITGQAAKTIPLHVYGGSGSDHITDASRVAGSRKTTQVFDTAKGNRLYLGTEASTRTTHHVRVHAYDQDGF